jgi:hypothetical protein
MCSSIRHWAGAGKDVPKRLNYVASPEGYMKASHESEIHFPVNAVVLEVTGHQAALQRLCQQEKYQR